MHQKASKLLNVVKACRSHATFKRCYALLQLCTERAHAWQHRHKLLGVTVHAHTGLDVCKPKVQHQDGRVNLSLAEHVFCSEAGNTPGSPGTAPLL